MIDLILTMIVAHDEYGDELGFKKEEIDNLIKKHDILKDNCNERGWIILWKKKYISSEAFAKHMDLEYDDGSFWLVANDFEDLLSRDYDYEAKILDGDMEWQFGDFYDVDVKDHFYMYNQKTLEAIIEYCDKKGCEIDIDDEQYLHGEDKETILMTKENTKIINGEIIIIRSDDHIKLIDVLDQLDELDRTLNGAICEAQESADQSELYQRIEKSFIDKIGIFKRKTFKVKNGKDKEKLLVRFDGDWSDIEEDLKNSYGDYEFQDETYGSLYHILVEMEYFDFRKPDYDYLYGSIDKITLNEYTQNRLDWD